MATPTDQKPNFLSIGISGPSSAGKTSLIALLTHIIPSTKIVVIHADAFYKDFSELPVVNDVMDGEGPDAIDFPRLHRVLDYAKEKGSLPAEPEYHLYDFIENDLENAEERLSPPFVAEMRNLVAEFGVDFDAFDKIIILDGCLLYHDPVLCSKLDIRLLLRTSKAEAAKRRLGRYDKEVPEGSEEFWKTRGYFEKFVWPHFVEEHAWLFTSGDIEAEIDPKEVRKSYGIRMPAVVDLGREKGMKWAVASLLEEVKSVGKKRGA